MSLADTMLVTRFVEDLGRVRKAFSSVKKRSGQHEDTIHEFALTSRGIRVGQALTNLRGVLAGTPVAESREQADGNRG